MTKDSRRRFLSISMTMVIAGPARSSPILLPAGANKAGKGTLPINLYAPKSLEKGAKADLAFAKSIFSLLGIEPTLTGNVQAPVFPSKIDEGDMATLTTPMTFAATKAGIHISYVDEIIRLDKGKARGLTVSHGHHTFVFVRRKRERDTLAHEVGHALGLDDVDDPSNLMANGLIRRIPRSVAEAKSGRVSLLTERQIKAARNSQNLIPLPSLAAFDFQLGAFQVGPFLSTATTSADRLTDVDLRLPPSKALNDSVSNVADVPEPKTALMAGGGLVLLLLAVRRRKLKGETK